MKFLLLVLCGLAASLVPGHAAPDLKSGQPTRQLSSASPGKTISLIILHTNDVHGHLFPEMYGGKSNVGGVARRGTLVRRLGAGKPNVLVLDAGDLWERGALSKQYHGKPEIAAMNAVGYDLMTLGNNEFRAGIPNLLQRRREARFPMLSANVRLKSTHQPITQEYIIMNRAGLRIGIFGLTTPRIVTYPGLTDLQVEDPFDAAHRMVKLLRPKVDLLIALTHIGFPFDRVLAEELGEIDVIVGGDTHTWIEHPYEVRPEKMPGKVIPIVQDGEFGVKQGRLELWVQPGHRPGAVVRFKGELIPVTAAIPDSPLVNRALNPYRPGSVLRTLVPSGKKPVIHRRAG